MTLLEKIGQLNQENCVHKDQLEEFKAKIRKGEIGSLMFSNSATAGNDEQDRVLLSFINEMQQIALEESPNGIPILFGRDVIHGHNTVLPIPLALTATFNPELIKEGYRCVAKEACNDGINWTFAPMVELSRDSRWGRCIEGIGEDPYLGGKIAKAIGEGFQ